MSINNSQKIDNITHDILLSLGYSSDHPPYHISDKQTALILGVKISTLAVWRSTGRYHLPYTKVGRLVNAFMTFLFFFLRELLIILVRKYEIALPPSTLNYQ
ncbi:DNA-binding protein [Edaphovirga cremea]|uniref:DNA-binding protein n=1 Tax=Edaphovirga cremea TaxID=2267246 RepID=UPI00398A381D